MASATNLCSSKHQWSPLSFFNYTIVGSMLHLLFLVPFANSAEIVLTLPDEALKGHIKDRCVYDHCEANSQYKTDAEKAQWAIDRYLRPAVETNLVLWSAGKVRNLNQVGGKLEIRYDHAP